MKKKKQMDFSIFSSFLPEGLLSHFDIVEFKELGDLQTKKDCFYIYFLDEKIKYQIYSIETVKPSEVTNHLGYNRSEGYCTLMTCTPIGVNKHRLLVHRKRIEVEESDKESVKAKNT